MQEEKKEFPNDPTPVDIAKLHTHTSAFEMTDKETKMLKRSLNKHVKNAVEGAAKLVFKDVLMKRHVKSLEVEHSETGRFWLGAKSKEEDDDSFPPIDIESLPFNDASVPRESELLGVKRKRLDDDSDDDAGDDDQTPKNVCTQPVKRGLIKKKTCVGCKTVLTKDTGQVLDIMCTQCANEGVVKHTLDCGTPTSTCECKLERYRGFQETRLRDTQRGQSWLWRNCYQCAGSEVDALRCTNIDCEYIYEREGVILRADTIGQRLTSYSCLPGAIRKWTLHPRGVLWICTPHFRETVQWANTLGLVHNLSLFISHKDLENVLLGGPKDRNGRRSPRLLITDMGAVTDASATGRTWKQMAACEMTRLGVEDPILYAASKPLAWRQEKRIVRVKKGDTTHNLELSLYDGLVSVFVRRRIEHQLDPDVEYSQLTMRLVPSEDAARLHTLRQEMVEHESRCVAEAIEHDAVPLDYALAQALDLVPVVVRVHAPKDKVRYYALRLSRTIVPPDNGAFFLPGGRMAVLSDCVGKHASLVLEYTADELDPGLIKRFADTMRSPSVDRVVLLGEEEHRQLPFIDTQVDRELDWEDYDVLRRLRGCYALPHPISRVCGTMLR